MSYTVAICISDMPTDDELAWSEANKLADSLDVDETPAPAFQQLHDDLTESFPCLCELADDEIDDGVWSDGPLINNFGRHAAVLGVVYSAVDRVIPFLIDAANSRGMTVFDWQTETIHRPGDLVFSVEGEPEIRNPTAEQMGNAIKRLTPNGGPGFAILGASLEYVQTAGGNGLFTAEWRQHESDGLKHWVAGKDGDSQTEVTIPTNGFEVTVRENERLNADDVMTIFSAFRNGEGRPTVFQWRDVSSRFE